MLIFSCRYLDIGLINFTYFVFRAVYWSIWTSLYNRAGAAEMILKVGGPGLKKLMSGGGGGGGGLWHIFFSDFKFFSIFNLIHVGVVLLHARPLWWRAKKKKRNSKSGWARPTHYKKWVGPWPTRFRCNCNRDTEVQKILKPSLHNVKQCL